MRLLLLIIVIVSLSSCSHWKWVVKHQDEVCAKCPQETINTTTQIDTTYWGEVPPDTIRIVGIDTIRTTVIVDNPVYKVIKEKGEVRVIIKKKLVPITVTKYRDSQNKVKIIETKDSYVPFWVWMLMPVLVLLGFYLRKLIFRLRKIIFR